MVNNDPSSKDLRPSGPLDLTGQFKANFLEFLKSSFNNLPDVVIPSAPSNGKKPGPATEQTAQPGVATPTSEYSSPRHASFQPPKLSELQIPSRKFKLLHLRTESGTYLQSHAQANRVMVADIIRKLPTSESLTSKKKDNEAWRLKSTPPSRGF